jgi:hypothetical protein
MPRFAFAAALLALGVATPAAAQSRVQVGNLECHGGGSMSFIVGSVNQFECVFHPAAGHSQRYIATIRRFGVDVGVSGQTVLQWLVFAPSRHVGYGALAGSYVGPSGSAAVGIGVSANALAGGSNNAFGLQPLSVGGGAGLNVAAGIADLELTPGHGLRPRRHG